MPELPEVERVRASLAAQAVGRSVRAVELRRAGVVTGDRSPAALLDGCRVIAIERLGKQLAIFGRPAGDTHERAEPRCLCVHLGMTGSLRVHNPSTSEPANHVHVVWHLDDGRRIEFRDPRRFGGVWTYRDRSALVEERWQHLGPDALLISPARLHSALRGSALRGRGSRRPIKAALLDQGVVAGLGNIYVDELLFRCGVHPLSRSGRLTLKQVQSLVVRMRKLLQQAIAAGGSTLRDYLDADGQAGEFQSLHRVYGRGGQPCTRCGTALKSIQAGGRTTVFCPDCQGRS